MQVATGFPEPVLKLRDLLNTYLDPEKVAVVLRAYEVGEKAHHGQTRKTGEPYILHPVAVAQILANMRMDHVSIAAAILHDTIEDTPLTWQNISDQFGKEIADLVDGVTKLDKMKFRTRVEADAESFRKLMLAMSRDLRVIFINRVDLLHNMRSLKCMTPHSRRRIARAYRRFGNLHCAADRRDRCYRVGRALQRHGVRPASGGAVLLLPGLA